VNYSTDRGNIQVMYHRISQLKGDFQLSVDTMISSNNGNGFVYIGLTDDINNVSARWWNGPGIEIGYYAGSYYADVAGRYADGTVFVSMSDDSNKDKRIPISANKWYTFELTKTGQTWKLDAYDENKVLVKSVTDEFTGRFAPFNYVFFGNGDQSQWETADGKLDNLWVTSAIVLPGNAKIGFGSTPIGNTNWIDYFFEGQQIGIYVDVDTSSAGFTSTPVYTTSLVGDGNQWSTTGASSIYEATPTSFRVYLREWDGSTITPQYANKYNWHIQWIGIGPA
jgi:hypothetical protein